MYIFDDVQMLNNPEKVSFLFSWKCASILNSGCVNKTFSQLRKKNVDIHFVLVKNGNVAVLWTAQALNKASQ